MSRVTFGEGDDVFKEAGDGQLTDSTNYIGLPYVSTSEKK